MVKEANLFGLAQEVQQQRTTITDLERQLRDAKADADARLEGEKEEKVQSFAKSIVCCVFTAYRLPLATARHMAKYNHNIPSHNFQLLQGFFVACSACMDPISLSRFFR